MLTATSVLAQPSFKVGWNTYKTGMITHQYTYSYTYTDSTVLQLTDTLTILTSTDSLVSVSIHTPMRGRNVYKTADYLNPRKQLVKTEVYKDDALQSNNEWRYDDKNRKCLHVEENKLNGTMYKKTYDYSNDKKSGDMVITESAYYNGKIEFYTKTYCDKKNCKYKEVRLNDNTRGDLYLWK